VATAEAMGMAVVGFVRGSGFNVYSHAERIDLDA
jgi:formate dehydrogenase assembly factor FdhD